jgi:hydroxymethylglutaryl-CoA lyase
VAVQAGSRSEPGDVTGRDGRVVSIIEVSPRDGLQNEARTLPTTAKATLVTELAAAGASRIEVTSFVRPDSVPQLADADDLVSALSREQVDASFIALVLNHRGAERALEHERIDEVNFVVPCTSAFGRANQGMSTQQAVSLVPAMSAAVREAGRKFSVTLAVAFGCPYQGSVSRERFLAVAGSVLGAGLDELAIADTIGCAVPPQVTQWIDALAGLTDLPLRAHFHDTRRTGLANVWAAYQAGVDRFDASAGGVGGCPFAPGAAGNVGTEDVAWMLGLAGVDPQVDPDAFARIGQRLCRQLGTESRSGVGRSGVFPPPSAP